MAGGTTIGEVSINLRMNLAQFRKDTADGSAEAGRAAKRLGDDMKAGTSEARGSLMLLGEEIGVHIPRHLQSFISQLPGVNAALTAAFNSVAVLALLEIIVKVIEKIKEVSEASAQAAAAQKAFNEQMEEYTTKSDAAAESISKIGDQLTKLTSGIAGRSTVGNAISGIFGEIGDAVQRDLPALADFVEMFAKGDEKAKAFVATAQAFTERLKDIEKTDGPVAALKAVTDELTELYNGSNRARADVAATITAFEAMQSALSHEVNDKFQKSVEDAAKAAKAALDEEWTAYQRMLKIAKQSDIYKVTDNHQTVEDMKRTGVYREADQAPNAGAAGQVKPTDLGAGIETKPEYVGANPELVKIQNDQKAAMEEAKKVYEETRTAAEKYADTMAQLNELLKQGKIDQETYDRAAKQAQNSEDNLSKNAKQLGADIGKTIEQAALFGRSWTDAFKAVAVQIAELILKMTLLKNISSDTTKGGGGFFSSLLSGLGMFGGGMADGGPLDSGKWYIAGEHGPEPIWGGGAGAFAAGYGKGNAGVNHTEFHMHVNGVTDHDSFKKSEAQIMADMTQMMAAAHARTRR